LISLEGLHLDGSTFVVVGLPRALDTDLDGHDTELPATPKKAELQKPSKGLKKEDAAWVGNYTTGSCGGAGSASLRLPVR
jgi:hypothetical protein